MKRFHSDATELSAVGHNVEEANSVHPYRVFVSYSHEDRRLAQKVVDILRSLNLEPVWDKDIRPGMPFSDGIKGLITHSHVFMPLITENSQKRPWVHQETGYAMAMNIPILPLAVGNLPGEMIAQLQALSVEDESDLDANLRAVSFEQVVFPPPPKPGAIVEVADSPEKRTDLIGQYARRVIEIGSYGAVRQCGALSSFCMPDKDADDPAWLERDGQPARSRYFHQLQREERQALELHARRCGCKLIVDPTMDFSDRGAHAGRRRLVTLLEFLESMADDKVLLVTTPKAREGSLTIVGDWFAADSLVPGRGGYRQTVFHWHAPTVLRWVRRFDEEFDELARRGNTGGSRRAAIDQIKRIIDGNLAGS